MKHYPAITNGSRGDCSTCRARGVGPCQWFDPDLRGKLQQNVHHIRLRRGATIQEQGERSEILGVILSGLVKVTMIKEDGDEHVLQLLHRGEIVGDPMNHSSVFAFVAATDVEICILPFRTARILFDARPDAYAAHLRIVLKQQLEQSFTQLSLRGRNTLERLAYWISTQVSGDGPEGSLPGSPALRLRVALSRRDLASLLDMTVETLCRNFHQLDAKGAVRLLTPTLIEVTDLQRLRQIGKDFDPKLIETVRSAGWEWGAVAVGRVATSGPFGSGTRPGKE